MINTQQNMKQPKGLYVLFFTELWERFSYYGMRALLILYMVNGLSYSDHKSYAIYGAYGSLIYATPLLGGYIADKFLGFRSAIIFGGILMALGHFCMAIEHPAFFYSALALLIVGNGLLKPNVAALLGDLYERNDMRRDAGFTLFYVGINLGGFLAPLLCGYVGQTYGWHYGFGLAGIGMVAGLVVFIYGQKYLGDKGYAPDPLKLKQSIFPGLSLQNAIIVFTLLTVALVVGLILQSLDGYVLGIVGIIMLIMIISLIIKSNNRDRLGIILIVIFMLCGMAYWSFAEQAGSSLNLYTQRNINRHLFGWEVPASMFQSINSTFILLLGPLLAQLWVSLAKRNKEVSTGIKFFLGLFQIAIGFVLFALGAKFAYHGDGTASMLWLIGGYFFMTTGELCVEPVGMAVVTRLSPLKMVGIMMGCWYIADGSFSNYTAAWIASFTSAPSKTASAIETAGLYQHVYTDIAIAAFIISFIILALTPFMKKMMRNIRDDEEDTLTHQHD